jgi:hypothetical protein
MNINLWHLRRGDTFVFDDDPETELVFLGMDGPYAKVRALDPERNRKLCAQYDAHSDFFAIMSDGLIRKVIPKCFVAEEQPEEAHG